MLRVVYRLSEGCGIRSIGCFALTGIYISANGSYQLARFYWLWENRLRRVV